MSFNFFNSLISEASNMMFNLHQKPSSLSSLLLQPNFQLPSSDFPKKSDHFSESSEKEESHPQDSTKLFSSEVERQLKVKKEIYSQGTTNHKNLNTTSNVFPSQLTNLQQLQNSNLTQQQTEESNNQLLLTQMIIQQQQSMIQQLISSTLNQQGTNNNIGSNQPNNNEQISFNLASANLFPQLSQLQSTALQQAASIFPVLSLPIQNQISQISSIFQAPQNFPTLSTQQSIQQLASQQPIQQVPALIISEKDQRENGTQEESEDENDHFKQALKKSIRKRQKKINNCGHPDREHYAKGMCSNCYHRYGRTKKPWLCSHEKLYACGLCQNCYINKYNQKKRTELDGQEKIETDQIVIGGTQTSQDETEITNKLTGKDKKATKKVFQMDAAADGDDEFEDEEHQ